MSAPARPPEGDAPRPRGDGRAVSAGAQRGWRLPPVTGALLATCLVAYLVSGIHSGEWWDIPASHLLRLGAVHAPALAAGEWWRLATAAFLHGGLPHLLANLVVLADAGIALERGVPLRVAAHRLLALFLLCASSGFALSAWWHVDSVSVGASGGILGFYGFWFARSYRAGAGRAAVRSRLRVAAACLGLIVLAGLLIPGVDNAAHLGGLAAGALLGALSSAPARRLGALAVAAGVGAAMLAFPDERAVIYRQHLAFEATYRAFIAADRQANDELGRIVAAARTGQLDDGEAAGLLASRVLPVLRDNVARWERTGDADAVAEVVVERETWLRYSRLRVDAAIALHDALTADDGGTQRAALARFESGMRDAARIADGAQARLDR